ncbi:MAG: hypothetical protein QMD94_05790, partial [Candidatus Omnitrophota bacterium]|nr:hypothetical protein [Candidatus Omnitrophota bacterium]
MKNRIILILAVLNAILFISTLSSCSSAIRQKAGRDKEMISRLDLEEKMNKFSQEKAALQESLKAKEDELEKQKAALEAIKKALLQEQLINQNFKEEIQKISKLKDVLEKDLKEALVADKA